MFGEGCWDHVIVTQHYSFSKLSLVEPDALYWGSMHWET